MEIKLKRIYDEPADNDGRRVLVDRIWPRGLSKDEAQLDEWMKDIAPSDQLRQDFHDDELSWGEFRNAYLEELKQCRNELEELIELCKENKVTLLYSSEDEEHNNAVVLKDYLKMLEAD